MMFSCLNAATAIAEPVAELALYTVTIPAKTQSIQERNQLLQEAFQKVLLRLSGSADFLKNERVQLALKQVDPFISRFTFEGFGDKATQPKALKVVFSPVAVNQLLKKSHRPIWKHARQNTLLWVGIERGDQRYWVTPESEPEIWRTFTQAFEDRAIPLVSPLFDLLDERDLPIEAVFEKQFSTMIPTLKRYGTQLGVLGLISEHPGGWHAEWFLFSDKTLEPLTQWSVTELALSSLLNNGLDQLGTFLSEHNPIADQYINPNPVLSAQSTDIKPEINPETQVAISGIQNSAQYASVLSYLKRITTLDTQIDILEIEPEYTLFRLRPGVATDILRRKLQQDALLFERYDQATQLDSSILRLELVEIDRL